MPPKNAKSNQQNIKVKRTESDKKVRNETSKTEVVTEEYFTDSGDNSDDNEHSRHSSEQEEISTESPNSKKESRKSKEKSAEPRFPQRRSSYHDLKSTGEEFSPQRNVRKLESSPKKFTPKGEAEILRTSVSNLTQEVTPLNSDLFSTKGFFWISMIVLAIITIQTGALFLTKDEGSSRSTISIESIKQMFPQQDNQLWRAVASGINDTLNYEHPTSFILLHDARSDKTVKKLLKQLSKYAVCQLSNCEYSPIKLNNEVLKSSEFAGTNDYGTVIARYKPDLENTSVMIVENLDTIPEKFALAFHSFCDEISPLVKKSTFFFTMKVDKLSAKPLFDLRNVENILRKKWIGMEDDIFAPLFTRLSGMLIRINPEKNEL